MTETARNTLTVDGSGRTGRRGAERLGARGLPFRLEARSRTSPFDPNDERPGAADVTAAGAWTP